METIRWETSDAQTERGRFEVWDIRHQTSDIRLQMSDGIEAVDFSVIGEEQHGGVGFLDCARNDGGFASQSDGQIKESTIKIFLIDNVENSAD